MYKRNYTFNMSNQEANNQLKQSYLNNKNELE